MDAFCAPRVLTYPRPVLVKSGSEAVLKCEIDGNPKPEVIWERKNESIVSGSRYCLTHDGKVYILSISEVTIEDAGKYTCRAKNNIGETYAAATLKVEKESHDIQLIYPLDEQQDFIIQPEQEVKVLKQPQEPEREADQFQNKKPWFQINPISLIVNRGEDAIFSCKLSGGSCNEVMWEKDGRQLNEIYESSHFSVSQHDGSWYQLKIFQTRVPDSGVYTCKAVNENGRAVTGALLQVECVPEQAEIGLLNDCDSGHLSPRSKMKHSHKKDKFSREKQLGVSKAKKFTIKEGKHAKFHCYVTGKPKPEIVWKKDGELIVTGRRHLMFEDRKGYNTLKVLYCRQEDTGLYICAASNALSNTLSAVHLFVKGPPVQFKQALQDVEVKERDFAILECEVPEQSIPTAWYLEDKRLQPGKKYSIEQEGTRQRLTIRDVEADDDGVYLCEMIDGGKSIAELAVKGQISKKLPRRLEVLEGENAMFCVEAEEDDIEVFWFKDSLKLSETHQTLLKSFGKTHILVLVNTSYQDSGTIVCMAGKSRTTCKLRVKALRHCPPLCPIGVQMNTDCQNGVVLSWTLSPKPQNTKSVYIIEFQEKGSQEWHHCITKHSGTLAQILGESVPCEGDYRFRICCVNKYGKSGHLEFPKVVHLVPGPKIKSPLKNAMVNEGEEAEFSIELCTELTGTWFLNSTQLKDSECFRISQSKNIHTMCFRRVLSEYSGAEITFIATGVRDSAVLHVEAAVMKFVPLPEVDKNKIIEAGNPIVLYCEVSNPTAAVHWFKDGHELHQEDGLNIQSDGNMRRIVIQSSEYSHSGVYTCQTDDDVIMFNVNIEGPPVKFMEIPLEKRHKSAIEMDPVVLNCELSRPEATVCWLKNGTEVHHRDNITIQAEGTMRRLIIKSSELTDAGSYICQMGEHTMSFTVNIKELPVMIVNPKDDVHMDCYVSEDIILNCELSHSNGEVSWFKDGLKVRDSKNIRLSAEGPYRRLTIVCASRMDSGEYMCETGVDSVFFQLCVTEVPVCILSPSESEVEVCIMSSEKLVLSCEISKADAEVCWYCDGMEVEESNNLILEKDGVHRRLVIPKATTDDSAEYVCQTVDSLVTFSVKIEEPPVKLFCSKNADSAIQTFSGEALVLELFVSRDNAEVYWMKDGARVEENSNISITVDGLVRTLTIHSPTLSDSGHYMCNAIDDTIDFQVNITEEPLRILKKDETKTVHKALLFSDIVLECELSRPNGVVKWYKDGNPIKENERFCLEEEATFRSLVILSAEMEDSGEYVIDAKDDNIAFHVTVQEPPVKIMGNSNYPDYQEIVAGNDLILECEVSRANIPVQWLFNEKPLAPDDRTYVESNGTMHKLTVFTVQPSDSGKYICDAINDKMVAIIKVKEPPLEFLNKEEIIMITGYETESITLTAMVSRANAPVCWLKDGTLVSGERFYSACQGLSHTLTINPLKRLDCGEYTCDAETDELHFSLLVKEMRIKFVKPLFDTVAHRDGMLTLCCEVCKSKADVQWLKDGVEISPGRRFSIRDDGVGRSLTIHRITTEDAGEYSCKSRDDCTTACVRVEMPRMVEFLTELHNTTVMEGEEVIFKCVVSPYDVHVVWFMDGEIIKPSRRFIIEQNGLCHMMIIHNVQLLDSCMVTADAEGLVSEARLKVQEAQVLFIKKKEEVMAEEFGEATLETEVNMESGEVHWIRKNVVIQPDSRHTLNNNGCKRSLRITNLTLSDRGTYRCESLHDCMQVKLNVESRKITINKVLMDTETFERETATFEVVLSHTDVEGTWQKNGLRVKPSSTVRVSSSGFVNSLTLTNLNLEDTGTITFCADGLRTSAHLLVKEMPASIVKQLSDTGLEEGSSITLECELSRHNVDVQWLKNGVELKSNKALKIYSVERRRCLQILESNVFDSGIYTCCLGDQTTSCKLHIYERELEIVTELKDLSIIVDQNAVFMCELSMEDVHGDWYKNGQKIRCSSNIKIRQEGTKHFLLICSVTFEDAGEIKFVSKQVESAAYLTIEELPVSIVRPLRDRTALENHRVILECTVSSPRIDVTWYKGDQELETSERIAIFREDCYHKLVIHQVVLQDEGTYSIMVGEHLSTAKLMVEAQSIMLLKELEDIEVSAPDPAQFHCELSVPLIKPPTWSLNGETLYPAVDIHLENRGTVYTLTFKKTNSDMTGLVKFTAGKATSRAKLKVV